MKHHAIRLVMAARLATLLAILIHSYHSSAAQEESDRAFYLRDGDHVVFYGDSITEQGHYAAAVENFVSACCPDLNVTFTNSGWSGDRAWGGEGGMLKERLQRDVVARKPTVVAVMLGMNDAYYTAYDPKSRQAFEESIETLLEVLERDLPGVRITLLGASPYDNVSPGSQPEWEQDIEGGYNKVVRRFSRAMGNVAKRHSLLFVDMNQPLVRLIERAQDIDPVLAARLIPDRIHPGPAAGQVMASLLLKAWNAPIAGAAVHIDAKTAAVVSATGCAITDVARAGSLRWVQQDFALPFPIDRGDPLMALALRCSPELNSLSRQSVRITNLPDPSSAIEINGQRIGVFSANELTNGVDLTSLATPSNQQVALLAQTWQLVNALQLMSRKQEQAAEMGATPRTVSADEELKSALLQAGTLQKSLKRSQRVLFDVTKP